MFNIELISIVLGVTIGIGGTVTILFPLLKKKGINAEKIIKDSNEILKAAGGVVNVADKLMPNNSVVNVLKLVDKYAHIGVNEAEQLYIASELSKDDRNAKARETIYAALNLLKIKRTAEMDRIIDGAIEAEVLALGHKEPTDAERQAKEQALQIQLKQLTQERDSLKNAIIQINATTQTV